MDLERAPSVSIFAARKTAALGDKHALVNAYASSVICTSDSAIRVFLSFLGGFLITFVILSMPLGAGQPNDHVNLWIYVLLQQGIWTYTSCIAFDMIMHASIPTYGYLLRVGSVTIGWLVFLVWWLMASLLGLNKIFIIEVLAPIMPAFWFMIAYYPSHRDALPRDTSRTTDTVSDGTASSLSNPATVRHHSDQNSSDIELRLSQVLHTVDLKLKTATQNGSETQTTELSGSNSGMHQRSSTMIVQCNSRQHHSPHDLLVATFGRAVADVAHFPASGSVSFNSERCVTREAILVQYYLGVAFLTGFILVYFALENMTKLFATANTSGQKVFAYLCFLVVNVILKEGMTRLTLAIDLGKQGTCCCYFMSETMMALFYFSFYRLLFESVETVDVFAGLQVLHVASEWMLYALRSTDWWHRRIAHMSQRLQGVFASELEMVNEEGRRQWVCNRALVYGVRFLVTIYSAIAFYTFRILLHFGWNRRYFSSTGTSAELKLLGIFLSAAVLVEALNGALMEVLFFQQKNLKITGFVNSLFNHDPEFPLYVVVMCTNLFCNVFVPFASNDFGSQRRNRELCTLLAPLAVGLLIVAVVLFVRVTAASARASCTLCRGGDEEGTAHATDRAVSEEGSVGYDRPDLATEKWEESPSSRETTSPMAALTEAT